MIHHENQGPPPLPIDLMTSSETQPHRREEDHDNVPDTGSEAGSSMASGRSRPVALRRAALTTRPPRRPMRQRPIWPPPRPVAVLPAAMAQASQTAHPALHCHPDGPVHHVLRKL